MSGYLQPAARIYHQMSSDERLSHRDRARALLWVGTALSKDGDHAPAAQAMARAALRFEDLSEAEDWAVAQQKLALAHRGLGDLARAWHFLDLATASGVSDSPLQQVRIGAARAHILLSDSATRPEGLSMLDHAALTASAAGLSHQERSIRAIRQAAA